MLLNSVSSFKNLFQKKYLCKAPFNSIYISGDGSITPCCFNRKDVLGNIYETPLKEILNNRKFSDFRKYFERGVFPDGCEICMNLVKYGNKNNSGIATYENYPVIEGYLSVIIFELSYKCNLRCTMCKLNEDNLFVKQDKSINKCFEIIEQIEPYLNNVKVLRFYGGEPFVIEEYYAIWEYVIKNNYKCRLLVQTNGTIYNKRVEELFNKGHFNFNISIDSINKETYELIRKGSHFEKTMSNLQILKKTAVKNDGIMSVSVCPMRINRKELPLIVGFCNKNNLYIFFNSVFSPWEHALWTLPADELLEIYQFYKSVKLHSFSKVSINNKLRWKSFVNQVYGWYELAKKRPDLSATELADAKLHVFEIIKDKTEPYIGKHLIQTDYNLIKIKIYNVLNDILIYISIDTIIEKINNTDAETIYNKIIINDESAIKEDIITL